MHGRGCVSGWPGRCRVRPGATSLPRPPYIQVGAPPRSRAEYLVGLAALYCRTEYGVRSTEYGVRSTEYGVRSTETGARTELVAGDPGGGVGAAVQSDPERSRAVQSDPERSRAVQSGPHRSRPPRRRPGRSTPLQRRAGPIHRPGDARPGGRMGCAPQPSSCAWARVPSGGPTQRQPGANPHGCPAPGHGASPPHRDLRCPPLPSSVARPAVSRARAAPGGARAAGRGPARGRGAPHGPPPAPAPAPCSLRRCVQLGFKGALSEEAAPAAAACGRAAPRPRAVSRGRHGGQRAPAAAAGHAVVSGLAADSHRPGVPRRLRSPPLAGEVYPHDGRQQDCPEVGKEARSPVSHSMTMPSGSRRHSAIIGTERPMYACSTSDLSQYLSVNGHMPTVVPALRNDMLIPNVVDARWLALHAKYVNEVNANRQQAEVRAVPACGG